MVTVRLFDERGWELQMPVGSSSGSRRGRKAAHVASAAAMDDQDWIFRRPQAGAVLLRGASLEQLFSQVFGRRTNTAGRRLPLLFGDRSRSIVPCTQVGVRMPPVQRGRPAGRRGSSSTSVTGATSRGGSTARSTAGIHRPPIVFFCGNNGWAVSTPTDRQTASETFARRTYAVRESCRRRDTSSRCTR
jgi:TPP-dependent pyruvate/acetoin dehydrogenase alpha subunit